MTAQNPTILHDNRFDDGIPVASSTAAGYDALNLRDWRPYTWWKPASLPANVTVDCGYAKAADYCVIWGHNLISSGCAFEVRGSTDNFVTSNDILAKLLVDGSLLTEDGFNLLNEDGTRLLVSTVAYTTDAPILLQFASASYRYWQINILGSGQPSIAICSIGAALVMQYGLAYGFDPLARKVTGQTNLSETGNPLGKAIYFESWTQTLTFNRISPVWLRSTFEPAWKEHLRSTPFVFAWNPGDYPGELYLVNSADNLSTPHDLPGNAQIVFDVSGLALA